MKKDYSRYQSSNDVPDKVKKAVFTITPCSNVDAPIINEYKLTLECNVVTFDEDENGGGIPIHQTSGHGSNSSSNSTQGCCSWTVAFF